MKFLRTFKFQTKYGLKNWPNSKATTGISLYDCVGAIAHLRKQSNVPDGATLWDLEKVSKLVEGTKSRKRRCALFNPFMWAFGVISVVIFLVLILYILTARLSLPSFLIWIFGCALVIFMSLFFSIQNLSRDMRDIKIADYFSSTLSNQQKEAFVKEIHKLKRNITPLFEITNYDRILEIPDISWKAENWFLLFTENEKDRVAIWLDGRYPRGELLIQKNANSNRSLSREECWKKLQLENFQNLVSSYDLLEKFIGAMKGAPLKGNQLYWLQGLETILENYTEYQRYLLGTLSAERREQFFKKFTPIFAKASKSKLKHRSDVDVDNIGQEGAINFLRGRNTSLEKWIKGP